MLQPAPPALIEGWIPKQVQGDDPRWCVRGDNCGDRRSREHDTCGVQIFRLATRAAVIAQTLEQPAPVVALGQSDSVLSSSKDGDGDT